MIFDRLENLNNYGLDLSFITEDLRNNLFIKGKFNINEPHSFGIGLEYQTGEAKTALWEAHRKYIDIHLILEGEEWVNVGDIATMQATNDYQDDYQLFDGKGQHCLHLKAGNFLILFPHEVHQTGIKVKEACPVKKKVYKYLIK